MFKYLKYLLEIVSVVYLQYSPIVGWFFPTFLDIYQALNQMRSTVPVTNHGWESVADLRANPQLINDINGQGVPICL